MLNSESGDFSQATRLGLRHHSGFQMPGTKNMIGTLRQLRPTLQWCERARSRVWIRSSVGQSNTNAAGLVVGDKLISACVPPDRDGPSFRSFCTFTADLHALADWLEQGRIEPVVRESKSAYWNPVYRDPRISVPLTPVPVRGDVELYRSARPFPGTASRTG
jgi:hypothetical protein